MNICYLEDSGSALIIQNVLCEIKSYNIRCTDDYRDVAEWITEDPDYFDILILDLNLPVRSLRFIPGCSDYVEETHYSPTLYFIYKYLLSKFPMLKERIILFSAYIDEYRHKGCGDQLDEFVIIDKSDPRCVENLIFGIDALKK